MSLKLMLLVETYRELKNLYNAGIIDTKTYLEKSIDILYCMYTAINQNITREEFEKISPKDLKEFIDKVTTIFNELNTNFLQNT